MRVTIVPPLQVQGTVDANPSKSHTQRAIALAALSPGKSILRRVSMSNDAQAAFHVAQCMGADIEMADQTAQISGLLTLRDNTWHCGEAGFSLRMFCAIAGLFSEPITLTGEGSLNTRPVDFMAGPIRDLGGVFESTEGSLPIRISGPLSAGRAHVDGSLSSQFLSGLLITLPLLNGHSELYVEQLTSKPYIDLTLELMQRFGVHVDHHVYERFGIPGNQTYHPTDLLIEGDWSGMAYFLVMGAIAGTVAVRHLNTDSTQADKRILEVLELSGTPVHTTDQHLQADRGNLRAFSFDATDAPDLFPPIASLCAVCPGVSRITGVSRLKHKESDRYKTLRSEFARMGIKIWKEGDEMCIEGGTPQGAVVHAHGDHRIAMALATVALRSSSPVTIEGAHAVDKSYPGFFDQLQAIGATISKMA